jgi:F1F0 ATPase subunit 2
MNEFLILAFVCMAGFMLGTVFFGGLWWTIRKGVLPQTSALLFPCSLLLRMSIALAGFYFIGHGDWKRLLLCLFGFIMARFVVTLLTRPIQEASHAS